VVLDDYQGVALQYADWSTLRGVTPTVVREHLVGEDAVVAALKGAEIAVLMRERTPITGSILARLPKLRLIVTTGSRNSVIDLAACAGRGVTVCGTVSGAAPAAELTWALILGLMRDIVPESTRLRESGLWQTTIGHDLAGATLGIVGLGRIGSRVAAVANAFDMTVIAWSPNLTKERARRAGAALAPSLRDLLFTADVTTLHMVLSWSTRDLLGPNEIAAMRPSSYLVNTARAGLVDSAALLSALQQGRIAGAGLDVFDEEPLPADHPLRTLPNVLATPHLGYVTENNYHRYFTQAVEDIAAWLGGHPLRVLS
jgi:phosphoglycerate dehydrogenase-like enzyme